MQNLLRRNLCSSGAPILCPSSPPTLLPSSSLPLIPLLGFNHKFTSYPLRFNKTLMPPSAATTGFTTTLSSGGWNPMISVGNSSSSSSFSGSSSGFNRCRICRCSIETSGNNNNRPWVVFKETSSGSGSGSASRLAWFRAFSSSSSSGFDEKGGLNSVKNSEVEGVGVGGDKGVVVSEGKNAAKLSRRQRGLLGAGGSGNTPALLAGNPDLLRIPGVGPRNLRKLVDNGIGGVDELKKIYKDKFYGKSNQKMVEFLQSSVGIIHRNHAESITTFIEESVNEEMKDDGPKPAQKKRLTFCVEGNISVGKTTFLKRIANETLELQDLVEIVPEPIDKWQDIGPDHFNILDAFYSEPQRYAYTFQNYVFVTRVMQEKESSSGIKPLRLMERSVFSDRMVFVRAVHEANWMNEMEISIYDSWFDPVVSSLPGLVPDGFIYLRASPDTCHKRMMLRKREEEGGVSLEYLRGLHEKHESWLLPFESGNHGVLSVSKLPLHMDNSLHPDIRDHVFYLEGNHMHSSIQKVPALVLDCEPNIDFSKDIEAKQQYARQVAKFFEFVKKAQEVPAKGNESQVLLPHDGGLFGKSFPDSLKTLDFKRAMSLMSTPSG